MTTHAELTQLVADAFVARTLRDRAQAAQDEITRRVDAAIERMGDRHPYTGFRRRVNEPRIDNTVRLVPKAYDLAARRYPDAFAAAKTYKRPALGARAFHGARWDDYAETIPLDSGLIVPVTLEPGDAVTLRKYALAIKRANRERLEHIGDALAAYLAASTAEKPSIELTSTPGLETKITRGARHLDVALLREKYPDAYAGLTHVTGKLTTVRTPYSLVYRAPGATADEIEESFDGD